MNSDDGGSSVELQTSRSQSIEERGISSYHQLFGQRHQCLKRHSDFANFLLQRRLENNHTRTTAKKELYYIQGTDPAEGDGEEYSKAEYEHISTIQTQGNRLSLDIISRCLPNPYSCQEVELPLTEAS